MGTNSGAVVEFRILGALQVIGVTGRRCALAPRQARLLATLLLASGRLVTRERLIEAVWDDAAPTTAARQLKNLVSSVRRRLMDAGASNSIITSDGPGYRLVLGQAWLDAVEVDGKLADAAATLEDGQIGDAVELMRGALSLWRGAALAGLTGRTIEAAAVRLNEQHLATLEQCFDLEMRIGRQQVVVPELTELVASHPLRERLVGQLMIALHRCGRQAEALAAYQRLRDRLADELGIDPGQALRDLHIAILRNDTATNPGPAAAKAVVPRRLPTASRHFVGRVAEVAESFPDGRLYLNLRGFDPSRPPVTPEEANLYEAASQMAGQAGALNVVGWYNAQLGNHEHIGYAHHVGHHETALTCYQQAIDLFLDLGDRHGEAISRIRLGDTHCAIGNRDAAREAWQRGLDILDRLGHQDADGIRTKIHHLNRPAPAIE